MKVLRNLLFAALAMFAGVAGAAEQADFRMCFYSYVASGEKKPFGCFDYRPVSGAIEERVYDAFRIGGTRPVFQSVFDAVGNFKGSRGGQPQAYGDPAFVRIFTDAKVGDVRSVKFDRVAPSGERFAVRADIKAVEVKTMKFGPTELQVIVFESTEYVGSTVRKVGTLYCPEIRMQCGSDSPYFGGHGNGFTLEWVNPGLLGGIPAKEQVAEAR